MEKLSLEKLHLLQLEIAKEIKRICDLNNINYFLIGGTLLGAVRHGGFIPWDDDIDIGMTTDEYNRFIKVAADCIDNRFGIHNFTIDDNYGYIFTKVRLKETHMREAVLEGTAIDNGIFVDIFPYDLSSEKNAKKGSEHLLKLRLLGKLLMIKSGYRLNDITHTLTGKMINTIMRIMPVTRRKCWQMIQDELSVHSDGEMLDYYIERDGMFKGNFVFPREVIDNQEIIVFENIEFNAPKEYDLYLKQAYGNYMKLPPEEERKVGHSVVDIILDKPFEWYFRTSHE